MRVFGFWRYSFSGQDLPNDPNSCFGPESPRGASARQHGILPLMFRILAEERDFTFVAPVAELSSCSGFMV